MCVRLPLALRVWKRFDSNLCPTRKRGMLPKVCVAILCGGLNSCLKDTASNLPTNVLHLPLPASLHRKLALKPQTHNSSACSYPNECPQSVWRPWFCCVPQGHSPATSPARAAAQTAGAAAGTARGSAAATPAAAPASDWPGRQPSSA